MSQTNQTTAADLAALIGAAYIRAHSLRRAVSLIPCAEAEKEINTGLSYIEWAQVQIERGWESEQTSEQTHFFLDLADLHLDRARRIIRGSGDPLLAEFASKTYAPAAN